VKADSPRNVFAQIAVGSDTQQSSVRYKTKDPRWGENFQFFVDDPETRPVVVEVRSRIFPALCTKNK